MLPKTSPFPEERRLVTVLFADIQGFTTMSEKLDPEEVGDILNRVWTSLDAIVTQHGGRIDKHLGDAVMAVWGAPSATEEDAERAVTCALALQQSLQTISGDLTRAGYPALNLRVGLNTGRVVTSIIGSTGEYSVIGDVVNVSQRLQTVAPLGGVVVGPSTYRMAREAFRFETLSPQPLRGKTAPVEAFLVLGPEAYPVRVRYRAAASVEVRMIGREAEMAQLNDALGNAQETRAPQFVLISGEPGVGKSRLLFEFSRRVELDSRHSPLFSARALAENARAPFLFWESLWTNRLKIMKDEPDAARREKFARGVLDMWGNRLGPLTAVEVAHTLGYLIGMDWPDSPYLESLRNDSPALSARVVALTAELFSRAAGVGPAVIMLDDLQHADTSSLNLFEALLKQPDLPLLIVGASRQTPDALRPDRVGRENVSHLVLRPLSLDEDNIGEIFQRAKTLPAAFRRRLAARADGSPYFLEEMVKALLQTEVIVSRDENWFLRDEGESESIPLPDSLRAQLQARLDAVSPEARAVAMTASVIGRTFWVSLVELLLRKTTFTSMLTPPSDNNWASRVAGALDELQRLELMFERVGNSTFVGQREFIFKNNLLRETAYGLLPRKYRYQYHALVADWFANRSLPDYTLAAAEHYELGGQAAKAAQFYRKAADHLTGRGLDSEARSALQAAERVEATPLKQTGALIPGK